MSEPVQAKRSIKCRLARPNGHMGFFKAVSGQVITVNLFFFYLFLIFFILLKHCIRTKIIFFFIFHPKKSTLTIIYNTCMKNENKSIFIPREVIKVEGKGNNFKKKKMNDIRQRWGELAS